MLARRYTMRRDWREYTSKAGVRRWSHLKSGSGWGSRRPSDKLIVGQSGVLRNAIWRRANQCTVSRSQARRRRTVVVVGRSDRRAIFGVALSCFSCPLPAAASCGILCSSRRRFPDAVITTRRATPASHTPTRHPSRPARARVRRRTQGSIR